MSRMKKRYCAAAVAAIISITSALTLTGCGEDKQSVRFIYDPGDAFVTNVCQTKYLLKSDLLLEISNPDNQEKLESEAVQADVRNIIIEILRSTPYDEIMSADAQSIIASKIKSKIEEKLQISYVENIYFNEFVVQH